MISEDYVMSMLKHDNSEKIKEYYKDSSSSVSVTSSHPTDNSVTYNVSITVKTEE